ncbi:MAG: hypothetical protein P8Y23_09465 [Candidatus Lokiarchaeota archaeon]
MMNLVKYGHQKGVIGEVTSSWGDFNNKEIRENRYYGFIFSSEVGWNASNPVNLFKFWYSLLIQFFGIRERKYLKIFSIFKSIQDKKRLNIRDTSYYNHFFSHPYNKKSSNYRKNIKTRGYDKLKSDLDLIISLCNELEQMEIKHKEQIQNLAFVAKHMKYFCMKRIHSPIKQKYLWLLKFYDRMISMIENKEPWQNPNIPSQTIYLDAKMRHNIYTTYYKKEILVDKDDIKSAYIQIMAGSFAKVKINNFYVGYVITRNSLNYIMNLYNLQIFNIEKYLQNGINTILIENSDFEGGICPINIYGEISRRQIAKVFISIIKSCF